MLLNVGEIEEAGEIAPTECYVYMCVCIIYIYICIYIYISSIHTYIYLYIARVAPSKLGDSPYKQVRSRVE